jgi:hypothetical protein
MSSSLLSPSALAELVPLGRSRVAILGGAWLAVLVAAAVVPLLPVGHRMGAYLLAHLALFSLALAIHALAEPRQVRPLLALAIVGQVLVAAAPPITSTDSARYVWDGAVLVSGHDPYALAPEDVRLDALAERFSRPPDHQDVPTCYPPASLALFAAAALAGPRAAPWTLGAVFVLASIALTLLVHEALRRRGRERDALLLALSPLVLFETGIGAHLDVLVALALTYAALSAGPRRGLTVGAMIGLAASLKVWPLALALVVLRHVDLRRFALGLSIGLCPFVLATLALGHLPFGSLGLLARTWSFGSPVWWILRSLSEKEQLLRLSLAAASLGGCGLALLRARSAAAALLGGLFAILVFSPTLYPWYAVPLVPLAALTRWLRRPALGLALVLPCSYEVVDRYQLDGTWAPATWPLALALVVVFGLLALEGWRALRPTRVALR